MNKYIRFAATTALSCTLLLIPNSFTAQGNGKGHGGGNGKGHGNGHKGGKDKVEIKIDFGKKGKGDKHVFDDHGHGNGHGPNHFGHPGHHGHGHRHGYGYYGYGHPGRGHAYGKYKWHGSPNIVKARFRHRELLGATIVLVGATVVFMNAFHPRLDASRQKLDLRIKAGGLDIKVRQRREARIKLAERKAKELDDLLVVSKVSLKVK